MTLKLSISSRNRAVPIYVVIHNDKKVLETMSFTEANAKYVEVGLSQFSKDCSLLQISTIKEHKGR